MNEKEFFETVLERMLPSVIEDLDCYIFDFTDNGFEVDVETLKEENWDEMKSVSKKALLDFNTDTKNGTRHAYGRGEADISKEDFKAILEADDCAYLCDIHEALYQYLLDVLDNYLYDPKRCLTFEDFRELYKYGSFTINSKGEREYNKNIVDKRFC